MRTRTPPHPLCVDGICDLACLAGLCEVLDHLVENCDGVLLHRVANITNELGQTALDVAGSRDSADRRHTETERQLYFATKTVGMS